MRDKRLEVKLSVRGDGSLSRNNLRSSTRSNRSNSSNNSSGIPVSEIFNNDRFTDVPYNRSFDILDKYRRQPNQYGYPAQSLQALNHYEQSQNNGYGIRDKNNSYIDYTNSKPYYYQSQQQLHNAGQHQYQPVYNDASIRLHGTLPRSVSRLDGPRDKPIYPNSHYTLPARYGPRRVRISELQPIVHGYGTYIVKTADVLFSLTLQNHTRQVSIASRNCLKLLFYVINEKYVITTR